MKPTLYDIVDTRVYVQTNCFQHQLNVALHENFDIKQIEMREMCLGIIPNGALTLTRLRLRTLANNLLTLESILKKTKLFVYEQDTWENFLVESSYFGSYRKICDRLPVVSFFNMSHWWSDLVKSCGLPSNFIQVWMRPEYCVEPIPWTQRKHDVVFCGTLYPHRVAFFDKLRAKGVNVEIVPSGKDYPSYLNLLSSSRITIRSEMISWKIDTGGGPYTVTYPNAQWQRDIECAARGCVSMREFDGEATLWNIDEIPSIMPFNNVSDATANIRATLLREPAQMDELIRRSVGVVRGRPGWQTVPDAIKRLM